MNTLAAPLSAWLTLLVLLLFFSLGNAMWNAFYALVSESEKETLNEAKIPLFIRYSLALFIAQCLAEGFNKTSINSFECGCTEPLQALLLQEIPKKKIKNFKLYWGYVSEIIQLKFPLPNNGIPNKFLAFVTTYNWTK